MLDQSVRAAIIALSHRGLSSRKIARELKVSRLTVRKVLRSGNPSPPPIVRAQKAEPYREEILQLYARCEGNLVRVHEELLAGGAEVSYPALTAFCRRHSIGRGPVQPAGHYEFDPAQEMQHDTSPHSACILGQRVKVQTASVVFCFSRMMFFQCYPTFNRFYCKLFLTEALKYFGGACSVCMVDNTSVVVGSGTGAEMSPAPEMEAFANRFDFVFKAHEKGDANRSARVERSMSYIENNFLAGREFSSLAFLNQCAVDFCNKANASFKRHLHARPRELFALETTRLRALPAFIPEVYQLHHRVVDIEGYVTVARHRYSGPWTLIGKRVEVRESKDRIELFDGPRLVGSHPKDYATQPRRHCLPEHRPARGQLARTQRTSPEEEQLRALGEPVIGYVEAVKKHAPGKGTLALRRLAAMLHDYPREAFVQAVATASHYRLYNLERLERMILRSLAQNYFLIPPDKEHNE